MRFRATGSSMGAAIPHGSFVWVEPCLADSVRPGEVYLYVRNGRIYLHRLLCIVAGNTSASYVVKGDALPLPDPPLCRDAILGRVRRVECWTPLSEGRAALQAVVNWSWPRPQGVLARAASWPRVRGYSQETHRSRR